MTEKWRLILDIMASIISIIGLMVACFCLGYTYALNEIAERDLEQLKQMLNRPTLSAMASYE